VCKTPETCTVTWQWNKIDCKQLDLVGYLKEKKRKEKKRIACYFSRKLQLLPEF